MWNMRGPADSQVNPCDLGEIKTVGVLEKGIKLGPASLSLKFSDLDAKGSEWKTYI